MEATAPDRPPCNAVELTRPCEGEPYWVDVPTEFPGLPWDAWAAIVFRAHLEPATATGPALGELTLSRATKFVAP